MDKDNNISPIQPGNENTGRLSEDKLLAYLEGRLSATEQHEVEQWLADESMESDAVEGLGLMATPDRKRSIDRLNRNLQKKVARKLPKRKRAQADMYVLVAVFIILLLAAVAFLIIRYMQ